jgi:hypothetical protein
MILWWFRANGRYGFSEYAVRMPTSIPMQLLEVINTNAEWCRIFLSWRGFLSYVALLMIKQIREI